MERFTIPRNIYYGKNALDSLRKIQGKNAVIVTGEKTVKENGTLDKVIEQLNKTYINVNVINGIPANPTKELVTRGAFHFGKYNPDWIIALGGGSVIDATKSMWVFYEHPKLEFEELITNKKLPKIRHKSRFIAIPTTYSVSSMTPVAMVSDWDTRFKWTVSDYQLTPDMTIIDNNIIKHIQGDVLLYSAMDSLSHAFESYTAKNTNTFSKALSIDAIKTITENIEQAYNGNEESKINLQYASIQAGMSCGNTGLGICHTLCDVTELLFTTQSPPHGLLSAMYLPYIIKYNSQKSDKYSPILKNMEINRIDELCENLISLNEKLGIPTSLKKLGIDFEDILIDKEELMDKVLLDENTSNNVRPVRDEDVIPLFENIFEGSLDF